MKIQVIFNGSYPIGTVSTHRVHHICKGLQDDGADVEVLIVHPTEQDGNINNHESSGVYENIKYRYIMSNNVRKRNVFIRKLVDIYCHLLVFLQLLFNRDKKDFYIVIGPSLDFRTFLPLAALFTKAKILLEINEYPFLGNADSIMSRSRRYVWLNFVVPLYDGFIVISNELDELMRQYKSKNSKIVKIPILGDFSVQKSDIKPPLDGMYIIHAGSLSELKDGIIGILKAYKIVLSKFNKPVQFVITGNTKYSEWNKEVFHYIKENGLEKFIVLTGFLSIDEMESYLRGSSLAVVNKYDNLQNKYCFSTKLADYLKYEVPIIATKVGELQMYLKDGVNAYIIEPDDTNILAEKMIEVISDNEKAKVLAKAGFELVEKDFNYKYQGSVLKSFLISMINKPNKKVINENYYS